MVRGIIHWLLQYIPRLVLTILEVGAEKYRQMRQNGETALPKPTHLDQARDFHIPSREKGRDVPCRLLMPEHGGQVKGVFMHSHGGGWVLMTEKEYGNQLPSEKVY